MAENSSQSDTSTNVEVKKSDFDALTRRVKTLEDAPKTHTHDTLEKSVSDLSNRVEHQIGRVDAFQDHAQTDESVDGDGRMVPQPDLTDAYNLEARLQHLERAAFGPDWTAEREALATAHTAQKLLDY